MFNIFRIPAHNIDCGYMLDTRLKVAEWLLLMERLQEIKFKAGTEAVKDSSKCETKLRADVSMRGDTHVAQ